MNYCTPSNRVFEVADISDTPPTEPVTVEQFKDYARLNGFIASGDAEGMTVQGPVQVALAEGATSVTVSDLVGVDVRYLNREGLYFSKDDTAGNRTFTVNPVNGQITFLVPGAVGGETLDVFFTTIPVSAPFPAFTFDDALIASIITGARDAIERWAGLSLVAHTWKAKINNGFGDVALPFGNSATVTALADSDGTAITSSNYVVGGIKMATLVSPMYNGMVVTYTVAPTCPERLKLAILVESLFRYENRGESPDNGFISDKAKAVASSYKLVETWLA